MMFSLRRILGAALFFSAVATLAYAADSDISLAVVNAGSEAERAALDGGYTDILATEAERAFESKGFSVSRPAEGESSSEAPRWALTIHCSLEKGMLAWWFELRDPEQGTLITADAFSAAAGLSVRDLLADSADSMAERWERSVSAPAPIEPIDYKMRFLSWDDGASVILGSAEGGGKVICTIAGKESEADYVALIPGRPIRLEVTKEGYWPVSVELPKGPTPEPIRLPRLMWKTSKAASLSWGPSRARGFTLSYRYFPVADALFVRTDLSPWKQDDGGAGAYPVSHLGLRFGGAFYLPHKKTDTYRFSLGAGAEMIWTVIGHTAYLEKTTGMDILVDPLTFGLELHFPRAALVLEQRFPFAVGGRTGFLDRGWLENSQGGMLHASLGVMYKW